MSNMKINGNLEVTGNVLGGGITGNNSLQWSVYLGDGANSSSRQLGSFNYTSKTGKVFILLQCPIHTNGGDSTVRIRQSGVTNYILQLYTTTNTNGGKQTAFGIVNVPKDQNITYRVEVNLTNGYTQAYHSCEVVIIDI